MDEGLDIEVAGDAVGDLREDDIKALRMIMKAEGVRFFEMKLLRKSMDPQLPEVTLGAFRVIGEHADILITALSAYFAGRMGRKVTIEVDGKKITASSKKEIDALIPSLEKLAKTSRSKKKEK